MSAFLLELLKAGIEVAPYVQKLAEAFNQPDGPTDAQLADLTTMEAELDNQLANAQPASA